MGKLCTKRCIKILKIHRRAMRKIDRCEKVKYENSVKIQ